MRTEIERNKSPLTTIDRSILNYKTHTEDYYHEWISDNYWVSVIFHGASVSDELLNDYLTAFPPNVPFSENDLNMKSSLKNGIVKLKFQRIGELEDKRNWFNRYINRWWEYVNMSDQCWEEQMVRCYVGLTAPETGPSCPIAFLDDKEERLAAYAKLEAEADKLPVIVENINFGDNMMGRCGVDMNETYQIADHLHVPKFIVKGVVDFFTPVR